MRGAYCSVTENLLPGLLLRNGSEVGDDPQHRAEDPRTYGQSFRKVTDLD